MDDEDKALAAQHKALWDAGDFLPCSDIMRQLRAKYPGRVRQEGDGTVALYDSPVQRFSINRQKAEMLDERTGEWKAAA